MPAKAAVGAVKKRSGRPWKKSLLLIFGASLIACVAFFAWSYFSTYQETDDAYVTAHITPVSSRIETNVEEILIDDNQHVKKGQLLIRLDERDFQRKVDEARTELERVRKQSLVARGNIALSEMAAQASKLTARGDTAGTTSAIDKATVAIRSAQFALAEQQDILRQKEAERVRAEDDFQRFLKLEKQGAVTTSERDAARRDFEVAKAAVDATQRAINQKQEAISEAKEQLNIARAQRVQSEGTVRTAESRQIQTTVSRLESDVAEAAIKEAEAKLADAQLQLSYCRISAPVAGRIGRKTVELGQRVQPGARLFTLTEDDLWVVANFKENQLEKMQPGQSVEIKVDILPHQKFAGVVESFSPGSGAQFTLLPPDNATGNFTKIVQRIPVKILFKNSLLKFQDKLVPGLSAIASVKVQ
ncbi:MAG: HlyD family secretion protein [Cyanobacteria bacterium REEB67]|nr:HlyD family secretion protein [Cyanobacteria bacterium REEB67]